jgi:hypothetical protein
MTNEIVISPVKDEKMNSHITTSEVWKQAYKEEEINEKVIGLHSKWYKYNIKFDGLKPVQMTKMKEM